MKYHDAGNGRTFVSVSAQKNSVSAVVAGVGMLLSPRALRSIDSIEKIQPKMNRTSFNDNLCTTVIFFESPTNISDETSIITFYNALSYFFRHIPKHNVQIIGGDVNAQTGKDENNKFCLYNSSK